VKYLDSWRREELLLKKASKNHKGNRFQLHEDAKRGTGTVGESRNYLVESLLRASAYSCIWAWVFTHAHPSFYTGQLALRREGSYGQRA
jgi:hypothetical protein